MHEENYKNRATTDAAARGMKNGWRMVKFGDVVDCTNLVERDALAAGLERYVGLEHIEPECLHIKNRGLVKDGTSFTRKFVKGQVLFGKRRAYQRKVAVAEFDGICSSDILTFQPKNDELISELLPFIVQSDGFFDHALGTSAGSLSPRTKWSQLKEYAFPLPPKDEQRRVAETLWAADEVIQQYSVSLRGAENLRRVFLSKLMEAGADSCRCKNTPLGPLPETWDVIRVGDAGEVQLGRQRAPKYQTGKYTRPYLRVANVFDNRLDLSDVLSMDFGESDFRTFSLRPGDILLNEGQSRELVGRCAMYHGEVKDCCFQNTLIRFRSGVRVLPDFALAWFHYAFYRGLFAEVARQTTSIAHLGAGRFSSLYMPIPPPDEQSHILHLVEVIGESRGEIEQHLCNTKNLKRTVTEQLLRCE